MLCRPKEYPPACLYLCDNKDYDNAIFQDWGSDAKEKKERYSNGIYIDNLCGKVERIFNIDTDTNKPLHNAKDRLIKRAIIQYFREILCDVSSEGVNTSKLRFAITYPSDWTPQQASYLRLLVQTAGIVDENDHPDRLLMYSENESIIRILQLPDELFSANIKRGERYLICDMSKTEVKVNMYEIELPVDAENDIKVGRRCEWDMNYVKKPSQLCVGTQDLFEKCEAYLLSRLNTSAGIVTILDTKEQDEISPHRKNDILWLVKNVTKREILVCSLDRLSNLNA